MPAMTAIRKAIIQHVAEGGANPGSHRTAAYLKWRNNLTENNRILKDLSRQDARAAKLKAKTDLQNNAVLENPEAELQRLKARGYVKSNAYWQGFMTKVAEKLDTLKNTSVLKPCIKYNKRSLFINMKKPIR